MVCLQRGKQGLADVEVSVLQFPLKTLKAIIMVGSGYTNVVLHLEHESELMLLLGGAPVDAGGVQQTGHLVHLVSGALQ